MITSIADISLPVNETLRIRKNRFCAADGTAGKRLSVVTGIHGDELEGQYVCYETARRLREHPEWLHGTVDLYQALNPLGIDSITRGIPRFDLDMNRIFPGIPDGSMTEYLATRIVEDLTGSDLCVDIHASNIYLTEMPQIRINRLHRDRLVPLAEAANVDFVWIHEASTVLESTLAHTMNSRGVPTLVVEMGVGMRLTPEYGLQMTDGLFSLMHTLGIWSGPTAIPRTPLISERPEDVAFFNSPCSGLFVKEKNHGSRIRRKDRIGFVCSPFTGETLAEIFAPADGLLFTIREFPIVEEGSLLGRMLCLGENN